MRSNGYNTKAKQIMMEYLKKNSENFITADDIKTHLDNSGNSVNVTTIYRFLNQLLEKNIIVKYVDEENKKATYRYIEQSPECSEHIHLKCNECGKIIHLDCDYMSSVIKHIKNDHKFSVKLENAILTGICDECLEKNKK